MERSGWLSQSDLEEYNFHFRSNFVFLLGYSQTFSTFMKQALLLIGLI